MRSFVKPLMRRPKASWSDQLWKLGIQSIIEVEKVVAGCQRWPGFAFEYRSPSCQFYGPARVTGQTWLGRGVKLSWAYPSLWSESSLPNTASQ